eukprot:749029-Pyramimonas_sp.AAC.1
MGASGQKFAVALPSCLLAHAPKRRFAICSPLYRVEKAPVANSSSGVSSCCRPVDAFLHRAAIVSTFSHSEDEPGNKIAI